MFSAEEIGLCERSCVKTYEEDLDYGEEKISFRLSITATKKGGKRKDKLTRNRKSQRLEQTQRQIEKYKFLMQTTYQTKEEVCFLSQNFNNSDNKNLFGRQFTRLLLSFHTPKKYSSINLKNFREK